MSTWKETTEVPTSCLTYSEINCNRQNKWEGDSQLLYFYWVLSINQKTCYLVHNSEGRSFYCRRFTGKNSTSGAYRIKVTTAIHFVTNYVNMHLSTAEWSHASVSYSASALDWNDGCFVGVYQQASPLFSFSREGHFLAKSSPAFAGKWWRGCFYWATLIPLPVHAGKWMPIETHLMSYKT